MEPQALVRSRRGVLIPITAVVAEPAELRAYRMLFAALLVNAILCCACASYRRHVYKGRRGEDLSEQLRRERDWILSDQERGVDQCGRVWFTFRQCCGALGLDAEETRREIRRRGWLDGGDLTWREAKRLFEWHSAGTLRVAA